MSATLLGHQLNDGARYRFLGKRIRCTGISSNFFAAMIKSLVCFAPGHRKIYTNDPVHHLFVTLQGKMKNAVARMNLQNYWKIFNRKLVLNRRIAKFESGTSLAITPKRGDRATSAPILPMLKGMIPCEVNSSPTPQSHALSPATSQPLVKELWLGPGSSLEMPAPPR